MDVTLGFSASLLALKTISYFKNKTIEREKKEQEEYEARCEENRIKQAEIHKQKTIENNARRMEELPKILEELAKSPLTNWEEIYNFFQANNYFPYIEIKFSHGSPEYRKMVEELENNVKEYMIKSDLRDLIIISDTKRQIVFNGHVVDFARNKIGNLINSIHDDGTIQLLLEQYQKLIEALNGKTDYEGYRNLYQKLTMNKEVVKILSYNDLVFEEPKQ